MYQEKIAKWQTQVEERLRVLGQRSGEALHSSLLFSSVFLPAMHKLVNLVSDVHFSLCEQHKTPEYLQAITVVCCVDCGNLGVSTVPV
jgi:hypothetical protein